MSATDERSLRCRPRYRPTRRSERRHVGCPGHHAGRSRADDRRTTARRGVPQRPGSDGQAAVGDPEPCVAPSARCHFASWRARSWPSRACAERGERGRPRLGRDRADRRWLTPSRRRRITPFSPKNAAHADIAFTTSNREEESLALSLAVTENLFLNPAYGSGASGRR